MKLYEDCINPTVCQVCGEVFEYDEVEHGVCFECFEEIKSDYGAVRSYVLSCPEDFSGFKDNESLSTYQQAISGNEDDFMRFYVKREAENYEIKRAMRKLSDIAFELNQNSVIDVCLEFNHIIGIVECRIYPYGYDNSEAMYYVSINGDNRMSKNYESFKITAENLKKLTTSLRKIWEEHNAKIIQCNAKS